MEADYIQSSVPYYNPSYNCNHPMKLPKSKPFSESRCCIDDLKWIGQRTRIPLSIFSLPLPCPVTYPRSLPFLSRSPPSSLSFLSLSPAPHSALPLLPSLSPPGRDSSKEMLHRLVMASIGNNPNVAYVKVTTFVAKMLREFLSREPVRHVFNRVFKTSLRTMKEWLEKYSSLDFRESHDETKAIQRLNLHSVVHDGKDLLWLLKKMTELRIAGIALKEWSEQTAFVADLQRTF